MNTKQIEIFELETDYEPNPHAWNGYNSERISHDPDPEKAAIELAAEGYQYGNLSSGVTVYRYACGAYEVIQRYEFYGAREHRFIFIPTTGHPYSDYVVHEEVDEYGQYMDFVPVPAE